MNVFMNGNFLWIFYKSNEAKIFKYSLISINSTGWRKKFETLEMALTFYDRGRI
jgi:hypothetical protein